MLVSLLAVFSLSACTSAATNPPAAQVAMVDTQTSSTPELSLGPAPAATQETAETPEFHNSNLRVETYSGKAWVASGLRLTDEGSFVRIAIDFVGGEGDLGYRVDRNDSPSEMGRGEEITTSSDVPEIDLYITNTTIPTTDEQFDAHFTIPEKARMGGVEFRFDGVFEGETHLVVGTPNLNGYRISQTSNPKQLILDVKK
ncbi:hypothetical protein BM477_05130 [Boudabousia marimammalium]|uniref:AMIN-like domain-containing protein n=1 Tax=Boudabousia marimammalium TaxID=156892 RepID=A0A1Q5PPI8_9ACTO|nr:hypothetical protein BM477_05130 [Boudabousia marimammalium]